MAPQPLDQTAVTTALDELPGWRYDDGALTLTEQMQSFPAAIELVDKVAEFAERQDHHPDIDIRWRSVTFRCSTHSVGAITELDLRLAARISQLVQEVRG